jgi:aspartate/methionine/tyrosine aminotransferase
MSIPPVMGSPLYPAHLRRRADMFEARAKEACDLLSGAPGVVVNPPSGAFYLTVMFEPDALNDRQKLAIAKPRIRQMVEELVVRCPNDQRFVYYLMGATGICVVPLTGFCCKRPGFRVTLLETDDAKRRWTFQTLASALREYVASTAAVHAK